MRFHRIRVENFRALVEPVEIADLDDGLTVIAGDNEAGKSTLVEAVKAALFERYKVGGATARSFLPAGHDVAPEIELEFSVDGRRYRLHKRFCRKASARLTGDDGRVLRDAAADEALQALLEFEPAAKGGTTTRNQGIWGLLWVRQGKMFDGVAPADGASRTLHGALQREVGDVLGGEAGQHVLDRLVSASREYWTPGWKPTGEYKGAAQRVEALAQQIAEVQTERRDYEGMVDELARVEGRLAAHVRDDSLAQARGLIDQWQTKSRQVEQSRAELRTSDQRRQLAEANRNGAAAAWEQRLKAEAELSELATASASAGTHAEAAADRRRGAQARTAAARTALREAEEELQKAEARLRALRSAAERQRQQRAVAELKQALDKAESAAGAYREARAAAEGIAVDDKRSAELHRLAREVERLAARREATATAVAFSVSVPVCHQGAAERGEGGEYLVTGAATFHLEGVGEVAVRAGGGDIAVLEDEWDGAKRALNQALNGLDVASVEEADQRLRERLRLEQSAAAERSRLEALAPAGVDALREQLAVAERRLGELPTAADEPPGGDGSMDEVLQAAEAALRRAGERAKDERGEWDAAREAENEASAAYAGAQSNHQAAVRQQHAAEQALAAERESWPNDALFRGRAEAEQALEQATADHVEHRRALEALDPDLVAARLTAARAAEAEIARDVDALKESRTRLRATLQARGEQGLGERQAELERELTAARHRHASLEREAQSVRLACQTLEAASRKARRSFLRPVTERVQVYLRGLFPDAEPVFDEELKMTGFRRGGADESFQDLSTGTREQLAIITRLAFADVLADQGFQVPIILDDALVYSDDTRLERMQDVIVRAAARHQIIVLTCHEKAYRMIGGRTLRLDRSRV